MQTKTLYRLASLFALISLVISTNLVAYASSSTDSLQATSLTFTANADAYVISSSPDANYGSNTTLRVDSNPVTRSYLRFSVSGLNGATIQSAKLRIYANTSNGVGYTASAVANTTWAESTITYNNSPTVGSKISSSQPFSGGAWAEADLTSYVKAEGSFNLALTTSSDTNTSLASRETGGNAPQLVVTLSGTSAPTPTSTPGPTPTKTPTSTTSGSIKHVFVVVMENHSYAEVWNKSTTPYITSLGNSFTRATNYHAITHPSLPNYLDLFAGSNYSITNDCSPSSTCHINAKNLADNLEAKGLTWKGYMESMPSPCYLTTSGTYAPKHNPFIYFDDIRTNSTRCKAHVVPFSALAADLQSASTTPNYAMISPNQCNDMHDCSIGTGDTWLKNHIPAILNSPACTVDKCLVALTWDEDDSSQSNQVLTIFAGSGAKTGGAASSASYTHFSLLRTVENIFGLPTQTTKDAAASPMSDLLR
jgi:hypothetical protein